MEESLTCEEIIKGKSDGRIQVLLIVLAVPMVPSTAMHARNRVLWILRKLCWAL